MKHYILISNINPLFIVLVILSWYPSLKLYQRFRTEQDIEMQQYPAEESRPLYHLPPSASLPLYSEVVRDPLQINTMEPPSYDEVITMKMKPIDSLDIWYRTGFGRMQSIEILLLLKFHLISKIASAAVTNRVLLLPKATWINALLKVH